MNSRFFRSYRRSASDFVKFVEKYEEFTPEETERSCWQTNLRVSLSYLLYRWLQFVLHFVFACMSLFEIGRWYVPEYAVAINAIRSAKYYAKWLLYLTHWGLLVNLVQAFVAALVVQKAFTSQNRLQPDSTEVTRHSPMVTVYCKLFVISIHLSTYITLGFWLMVYEPLTCSVDLVTLSEHGFGNLLMLIDLVVAGTPYKLVYGLYTIALSFVYICLTFVHYLFGCLDRFDDKPYIYERCNWEYPLSVIFYYIVSVFILSSFHLTLWGIYLVRRRLSTQIRSGSDFRSSGQHQDDNSVH